MASAAFAAQNEPAQYGYVVVGLHRRTTIWTTRAGRDDRDAGGNPRDADVEEATDHKSEEEKRGDDHTFTVTQEGNSLNWDDSKRCPMANGERRF